jgi:hypothetical protein
VSQALQTALSPLIGYNYPEFQSGLIMRVLLIGDSQGSRMFPVISNEVEEMTGVKIDYIWNTGWGNSKYASSQMFLKESGASSNIKAQFKGKTLAQFLESQDPYDLVAIELGGNDWYIKSKTAYKDSTRKLLDIIDAASEPRALIWIGVFAAGGERTDVQDGKENIHNFQTDIIKDFGLSFLPMLSWMKEYSDLSKGSGIFDDLGLHIKKGTETFDTLTEMIAQFISDHIEKLEGEDEEPSEPFEMFPEEEESYYEQMEFDAEDLEFEDVSPEEIEVVEETLISPPPNGYLTQNLGSMVAAYKKYRGWDLSDDEIFQQTCLMLDSVPPANRPNARIVAAITKLESVGGRPYVVRFEHKLWANPNYGLRFNARNGREYFIEDSADKGFDEAFKVNPLLTVLLTSWGLGQVMGFNFFTMPNFPYKDDPEGWVQAFNSDPLYWSSEVQKIYFTTAIGSKNSKIFVEASHVNPPTGQTKADTWSSLYKIAAIYNAGGLGRVPHGNYVKVLREKWNEMGGKECGAIIPESKREQRRRERQERRDVSPFDHPVVPADGGGMGSALVVGGLAVGLGWFILKAKR